MPTRSLPRAGRTAFLTAVSFSLLPPSTARATEPAKVRIVGQSRIHGSTVVTGEDELQIQGRVRDDLGAPVTGGNVRLSVEGGRDARWSRCSEPGAPEVGNVTTTKTDEHGRYCVRIQGDGGARVVTARFLGNAFYLPAKKDIPLHAARGQITIDFDAPFITASLDRDSLRVPVTVKAASEQEVRLVLSHATRPEGERREVAALTAVTGSRAQFNVETALLRPPGTGQLTVRYAGSASLAPAEASVPIHRTARVQLSIPKPVPPADPVEGVALQVIAQSGAGGVPTGWVEALYAGNPVGVAPIQRGAAAVVAQFHPPRAADAALTLRYVSRDPWWIPSEPVRVSIPLAAPSPWQRAPWVVGVLAVAYWIVRTWRRPGRARRPERTRTSAVSGRAGVEVIERARRSAGWEGRVLDAHEGTPVSSARLEIRVPSFEGSGVAARAVTDSAGRFELADAPGADREGAELKIRARYHSELVQQLPPPGLLAISVVSRRRALLERLVRWTKRQGPPWSRRLEPTPGDVAGIARQHDSPQVATWARAVQDAAYGPAAPEEQEEQEVLAREPKVRPVPENER